MKPKKLTPRVILVALVLLATIFYLLPTVQYEFVRRVEEKKATVLAEKLGVSYAFVIENLTKDEAILRDKLTETPGLSDDERIKLQAEIEYLQVKLQDKALKYRKRAIKRGLDLQGGMHLVLEVDLVQLLRNMARVKDAKLDRILASVERQTTDNPSLSFTDVVREAFRNAETPLSTYFGEAGESDNVVLETLSKQADDAINRSREILANRIDQFGVSEPTIQKQGVRRIILELPGIQDPARARDLIGRTALLEFNLLEEGEKVQKLITDIDAQMAASTDAAGKPPEADGEFKIVDENKAAADTAAKAEAESVKPDTATAAAKSDTGEAALNLSEELITDTGKSDTETVAETSSTPFSSLLRGLRSDIAVPAENIRQVRSILAEPTVDKLLPEDTKFVWGAKPDEVGGKSFTLLYLVKEEPELTGSGLSDARVDISQGYNNPGTAGQPIVSLTLNRAGARKFARVTGANIGKRLAIVLDDKVYMAPSIRTKIPDGRAIIEGSANVDEANDIAIVLRAGALPTTVVIEEERTVGPSLGRDSIRKGTLSAIVGMILVIIFMVIYYGMSGIIANVALLMNVLLIFGGLAFIGAMGMGASLSLPGIAGIILTIGMAVDANVLIFERIREELETGKTVWHAISAGYDRAFTTILDSNLTTLIAALVLLQFGTGPIRGFAVTLSIGITASMFTAIFVTRLIFDYINSRRTLTKLSI